MYGLGPLERWIADDEVTEVMINAGSELWIERRGAPARCVARLGPEVVDAILERVLEPIGRRLDHTSPIVDARWADGTRVCAVLPPVAVDGTCLSMRRFATAPVPLEAFASAQVVALLDDVVASKDNVVVSGATSAGKTTLLNALAARIAPHERVVTMEDVAELRLPTRNLVRLECRAASADGLSAIPMDALLRTALRLRPDRLVVGEVRGAEAIDLVQALNTGHDGSLATVHANSAGDALARLESLIVLAGPSWPLASVREQVRRCIDVVVHVDRRGERRRVASIAEVPCGSGDVRELADGDRVVAPLTRRRA